MKLYKIIFFSFSAIVLTSCQFNQDKTFIDKKLENINISNKIDNNIIFKSDSVSKVVNSYKYDSSNKNVIKKMVKNIKDKIDDKLSVSYNNQSKNSIVNETNEDTSLLFENFEKITFKTADQINNLSKKNCYK